MKQVKVVAWDDIHAREGRYVEADEIDVPVRFGDIELTADLTEEHYQAVYQALSAVLGAAVIRDAREEAVKARLPGAGEDDKKKFVSPMDRYCPFPARTPERHEYLKALRFWADSVGRGDEYRGEEGSRKREEKQYHYNADLLIAYNEALAQKAREQHHKRAS